LVATGSTKNILAEKAVMVKCWIFIRQMLFVMHSQGSEQQKHNTYWHKIKNNKEIKNRLPECWYTNRPATVRSIREVRSLREIAWLNTPSRLCLSDFTVRIESIKSDHLQLHYTVM